MLKLFTSSDLNKLADSLLAELQNHPPENPLEPEIFVVQNYGMARWLSLYIAEREEIAANLEFKFPAEVYWQIMREMVAEIPENLPSERLPMRWAILQIIQHSEDPALTKLYQYVRNDDPQKQEMRCWNLAGRIADVFDQYLTYRPEMLRRWETKELTTGFGSEKWQAHLWRKLTDRWNIDGKTESMHRATLEKKLVQQVDDGNIPVDTLPARITIFGVSDMPEVYIKTLIKLSKLTGVHFYTIDMSRNKDHPLIQSLAKVGLDFQSLIKKHVKLDQEIENTKVININGDLWGEDTFFQQVRHELITGEQSETAAEPDRSIQVHSCHSPRREVEVLYDQLLCMLDEDEALDPSDIMVYCPRMDEYGPEIEAIFGAVEKAMPEIPFHMAEKAEEANIADLTFRKLLQIVDSRFKVTDMLDLLDAPPIRKAFSFNDEDANTLERWIGDTRIHWGISGEQKRALDLPASDSFTWRAGWNRMMAGYAMQTENDSLFQQIYPYDEIQQTEDAQLLGRFSRFLNQLFACHHQIDEKRTLSEWGKLLYDWLSAFFPADEPYFRDLQKLREIVHSLQEQQKPARVHSRISFRIIRSYLEDQLDQKATGGGRPGRGVTFSGMVPMRNIPAKMVCMIGMNDGEFPRSKDSVEFNLITKNPRQGDRLPGKEDRQMFLEHVLAAREQIYFSYVGRSNNKEGEYPPSVVVREFLDYLNDRYKIDEDKIVQKHKLQLFSIDYFTNNRDKELFSYSFKNRDIADRLLKESLEGKGFITDKLPEPDESFKQLSVKDLVAFFQHPAKFLLQQRLGIFLYEDEVLDEDRESFDLDGLARYKIGREMLDRYLGDQPTLASFKDIALAKGLLPEGWPGERTFNSQARQVQDFGQKIQEEQKKRQLEPIEIDLKIGEYHITGRLEQIYEHRQLLFRFGGMRAKDLIELWIKHLLFQTVKPPGHSGYSRLYTRDDSRGVAFTQFVLVDKPKEILQKLMQMYWSGLQRDILFYPNSSFAFAEKVIYKNETEKEGFKTADREWIDRYRGYPKEGDDPYIKRLMSGSNPFDDSDIRDKFKQVSRYFWEPLFRELNKSEEGAL